MESKASHSEHTDISKVMTAGKYARNTRWWASCLWQVVKGYQHKLSSFLV